MKIKTKCGINLDDNVIKLLKVIHNDINQEIYKKFIKYFLESNYSPDEEGNNFHQYKCKSISAILHTVSAKKHPRLLF